MGAAAALFTVGGCVWLAPCVEARPPQSSSFDLEGTISRRSPGKLTISSGENIIFHVTYDDKTTILEADGKPGSERDLKVGIKVHILGELEESGEVKAQKIEIEGKGQLASDYGWRGALFPQIASSVPRPRSRA
jgi:hypothetical protein